MKKLIALICAFCLCFAFAGCKKEQAPKEQAPEEVLKSYFAAIKSNDEATMKNLSVSDMNSSSSSSSSQTAEDKEMIKLLFGKIDTDIEEKALINGDSATVKAKIIAPDSKKIMQNCIESALKNALSNALSSSQTSSSDASTAITKQFKEELKKSDVALSTTEMNVQMVKKDGKWKVKVTENLTDALCGGLYSYAKSLASSSK